MASELVLLQPDRKPLRRLNDAYYTPPKPVRIILHELRDEIALLDGPVIEPSAGAGSIVQQLVGFSGIDPRRITACDVDADALAICRKSTPGIHIRHGDFRSYRPAVQPALIAANPPYLGDLPEEFVEHAFGWSYKRSRPMMMFALLRLGWLGSQGRAPFHRRNPADIYILPDRPSFTGDGATDASEYAWYVWRSWRLGGRYFHLPVRDPAQGLLDFGG